MKIKVLSFLAFTIFLSFQSTALNFTSFHINLDSLPLCEPEFERNERIKFYSLNSLRNHLNKEGINYSSIRKVEGSKLKGKLPEELGELINLEVFQCKNCEIETLPEWFSKFKKLRIIEVTGTKDGTANMTQIAYSLKANPQLEEINLRRNRLQKFPEGIEKLKKLKKLNLSFNQIESIPKSIKLSPSLEVLSLSHNKLSILNNIFPNRCNLKSLDISSNKIQRIYPFYSSTPFLKYYILRNNPVNVLSDDICSLLDLIILDAKKMNLKKLPDCITQISSLRNLEVNNNQLRELPKNFENLRSLTTLLAENNPIDSITFNIDSMYNLRSLYLGGTKITYELRKSFRYQLKNRKNASDCYGITGAGGTISGTFNSITVLERASFPGGMDSVRMTYTRNFVYPEDARKRNITGKVRAIGKIDETGSPVDLILTRSPGGGCGKAFLEMLSKLKGAWNPAIGTDGKPRSSARSFGCMCEDKSSKLE